MIFIIENALNSAWNAIGKLETTNDAEFAAAFKGVIDLAG